MSDAFLIGLYDEQQVPIRAQHPLLEELARLFDYLFEGGDGSEDDAIRDAKRNAHFREVQKLMRANRARALALKKKATAKSLAKVKTVMKAAPVKGAAMKAMKTLKAMKAMKA